MKKVVFIAFAIVAIAVTSGCTHYGKGKSPVVETNG